MVHKERGGCPRGERFLPPVSISSVRKTAGKSRKKGSIWFVHHHSRIILFFEAGNFISWEQLTYSLDSLHCTFNCLNAPNRLLKV